MAVLLGLFVVGLGQYYSGETYRGVRLYLVFNLFMALLIYLFLAVDADPWIFLVAAQGLPALYIYSLVDAYRTARAAGPGAGPGRRELVAVFFLVFFLVDPLASGLFTGLVVDGYTIPGTSMEPTILDGERLFVLKMRHRGAVPRRGDVVVFRLPDDDVKQYIKRVVAVGGDTVELRDGRLYVNGAERPEPYLAHRPGEEPDPYYDNAGKLDVPYGEVFVLGDNRHNSYDSRSFGTVPVERIEGKAMKIYYSYDEEKGEIRWERIGKRL